MAVVPNDYETGYAYPACNASVVADDDIVADRRVRQDVDVVFNASLLGDGHMLQPPSPKSAHMRFVHSCCGFALLLGGYALDRHWDLRCIIEGGKFVLPWAMLLHRLL